MKNLLLAFLCTFSFYTLTAQSNQEISNVYIKRAQQSLNNLEIKQSLIDFTKAMKYTDTITSPNIAKLGVHIHYELGNFKEAKGFAKQYFLLAKNRNSEEYNQLLDLSVNINEQLEEQLIEEKKFEKERIRKEKELKVLDSLKTIWNDKATSLSLKVDSIYRFDKNNLALFRDNGSYGIINDRGKIIVQADEYKGAIAFDGFILFMDTLQEPTKIYSYNRNSKEGFLLPNISDLNPLSTHYGKVMLPRANGRLVTYPNNSYQPMVYDLNTKKVIRVSNEKTLFKDLKRRDIIDKFNKEGEVKINKIWYSFGGHLGGGIYPLYKEKNYDVHSFLCAIDGTILDATSDYQYIGAFYKNTFQAIEGNKTVWINQNGTKVNGAEDEAGSYSGSSKIKKLKDGSYQILQDGIIILGDKKLEKMEVFLRKNIKKNTNK
ncbi:MAG: hypothetical protein ACPGTO_02515 [Polaribacter sp.]